MPAKETSPTPMSGGFWSEAKWKSSVEQREVKDDDDDDDGLLTLSLGPIRSNNTAAAAVPDDCLPVTPTLPAPLRPVNVAIAPPPPPSFAPGLAATAVHGGNVVDGAFLAAAAGALTAASELLPPTRTLPLLPSHFPSGGGGGGNSAFAVPVHGTGITPTRPPSTGFLPPANSPPAKSASAPPKKRRRVTTRSNNAAPSSNGAHSSQHQPPFPWAKPNRVAEHYSLAELSARGIATVDGEVQCKRCDARTTLSLDIEAKFKDLRNFIACNVQAMDDRAPEEWKDPALPDCDRCGKRNSLRPVIAAKKEKINWVFLLLGQTLGLCTLEQLKHFCAHTNQHRTGAKDRVLYSTYMELCNQLCPGGPFDMAFERRNRARPAFV